MAQLVQIVARGRGFAIRVGKANYWCSDAAAALEVLSAAGYTPDEAAELLNLASEPGEFESAVQRFADDLKTRSSTGSSEVHLVVDDETYWLLRTDLGYSAAYLGGARPASSHIGDSEPFECRFGSGLVRISGHALRGPIAPHTLVVRTTELQPGRWIANVVAPHVTDVEEIAALRESTQAHAGVDERMALMALFTVLARRLLP